MPGEPIDLLCCEESGIGCRAGGFHIDPWKPVPLAVMTDPQFRRLMKVLGREEVLDDPRFVDWATRIANNTRLVKIAQSFAEQVEDDMKKFKHVYGTKFQRMDESVGQALDMNKVVKLSLKHIGGKSADTDSCKVDLLSQNHGVCVFACSV
jgi:hypothetical protein